MDVCYVKVMCRIKFHVKHFYVYHVALAFAHFATCRFRDFDVSIVLHYKRRL